MQSGNLIGPIIVAIGVIIGAIAFAVVGTFLQTADSGTELRLNHMDETIQAESQARAALEAEIAAQKADLAALRDSVSLLANQAPAAAAPPAQPDAQAPQDPAALPATDAVTEQMKIAKARYNTGITQPGNKVMLELLGRPRESFSNDCQPITSDKLKALLETRQVGPIKVAMLKPALDSLQRVFDALKATEPDIYAAIGTAGTVCARFIRGSTTGISNHSWGTAIDVTLAGKLDPFADGGTQFGLLLLAEKFNDEGWYWGAGYDREDSMHFEVGEETLRRWAAEGKL